MFHLCQLMFFGYFKTILYWPIVWSWQCIKSSLVSVSIEYICWSILCVVPIWSLEIYTQMRYISKLDDDHWEQNVNGLLNCIFIIRYAKQNVSMSIVYIQAPVLAVSWSTLLGNRTAYHSVECFNTHQVTRLSYLQQSPLQVYIYNIIYVYIDKLD